MSDQGSVLPYNGTIRTRGEDAASLDVAINEYYRLPLKERNEIVVCVKASYEADLVLYDADTSADSSPYKVQVVIGGSNNTTASISLIKGDDGSGLYQTKSIQQAGLLSGSHMKTFVVRWAYGRIMVYNDGFKQPFISWDGPKGVKVSNIGFRTVGCSGDWVVQGLPIFKTPDSSEYHDVEVNCGRFDFEVKGVRDCYINFTPTPKWDRGALYLIMGGWGGLSKRSALHLNRVELTFADEATTFLSPTEYRAFWVKWDACNIFVGRGGSDVPFLTSIAQPPILKVKYFGLQSSQCNGWTFGDWHILDMARPEDVAPPGQVTSTPTVDNSGQGQTGTAGGAVTTGTTEQTGYVVFQYQ